MSKERKILDFLQIAENLKSAPRHCYTKDGVRETVAAHSWQLSLWAYLIRPYMKDLDMDKVIRMCIIHDLGEAITGDIPVFLKTDDDRLHEDEVLNEFIRILPDESYEEIRTLLEEMNEQRTAESRLYKALDKMEGVLEHNFSDIKTWEDHEYDLQRRHGRKEADVFEITKKFRELILEDTEKKIREEGK